MMIRQFEVNFISGNSMKMTTIRCYAETKDEAVEKVFNNHGPAFENRLISVKEIKESRPEEQKTLYVYDAVTNAVEFIYTKEMEPEIVPAPDNNSSVNGPFTVFYLSGFEEEDNTDYTECHYTDRYYARIGED